MGSRVLKKKPSDQEEKNHLTRTTIASNVGIELAYWWADECFCASLVIILLFSNFWFDLHKHTRYKNRIFFTYLFVLYKRN